MVLSPAPSGGSSGGARQLSHECRGRRKASWHLQVVFFKPSHLCDLSACLQPHEHNGSVFLTAADEAGASLSRQIS